MMEKLEFLIGKWNLKYDIPESSFSHATAGTGEGIFRQDLEDKVILFDSRSDFQTQNIRQPERK